MISGTQFGITRAYALKQEESRLAHKVQNLLIDQLMAHPLGSPEYYVTLYYGKSFTGGQLDSEEYRKRWDREEIKKTHKFIKNLIHKSFGELVPVWFTIERHRDYEDENGNNKKGFCRCSLSHCIGAHIVGRAGFFLHSTFFIKKMFIKKSRLKSHLRM